MRTKSVLLAALCGLVGASAVEAQSVYSVNAVGYVNTAFKKGVYKAFANPLNTTNNYLSALIPSPPDGTQVFLWSGTGYATIQFYNGVGWYPDTQMNPGQGAFLLSASDFTNTFVGEVLQGSLTNTLIKGYTFVASLVPQAGTLDSLGLTNALSDGDQIFQWNATTTTYDTYQYFAGIGIYPNSPTVAVGEPVFVLGSGSKWVRSFSVN